MEVKAGDTVYNKDGEPVTLEEGVVVFDKDGNEVTYDGTSPLTMKQLVVDYKFLPVTWSDGTPVAIEDFALGQKIDCDKDSGATSFITCESIADVKWADDGSLAYTVTYLPGVQTPTYFLAPFIALPEQAGAVRRPRAGGCAGGRMADAARDRRIAPLLGSLCGQGMEQGSEPGPGEESVLGRRSCHAQRDLRLHSRHQPGAWPS